MVSKLGEQKYGLKRNDLENKKIELQDIDKIVRVKHSPAVSTFISLIKTVPCFLDLFDDSLEYILQNFQNKKQQQLLDFINNTSEGTVHLIW